MKRFRKIILYLSLIGLLGLLSLYLINRYVQSYADAYLKKSVEEIPIENPPHVAIVFGAGVWSNGTPSHVLYDRIETAVNLYKSGRVQKILMSGDNPTHQYDEPTVMKETAVKLGVPETDVVADFAGRRTYDTCWRAKEIFEIKSAILVTQEFHQARALYLCNNLGVESIGIASNPRRYEGEDYWAFREIFSIASAWLEMNFVSFSPIGGQKEPIQQ